MRNSTRTPLDNGTAKLTRTHARTHTQVIKDADEHGAAVLAVPMKATVKESADGQFVLQTIDRSRLWEIHTPQVRGLVPSRARGRTGWERAQGGVEQEVEQEVEQAVEQGVEQGACYRCACGR